MAQRCPKFCFFALKSRWIPIFKLCLFIFRCQQSLLDTILPASVAYLLICTSFAFAHWWLRTLLVANVVMAHWQEKSLCVFVLNNGMLFFFSVLSGIILPVSACHAASPCRELTVCLSGCVNVWLYLNKQYREHVFFLNAYLTYYIPYVGLVWSDVCVFPPKLYVCMSYFHEFKSYLTQQEKSEGAGGQLISPGTTGSHYWKLYFKTSAFSWCYFLFFFCDYFSDLCALWDYFPPSSLFDNMKC